MNRSTGLDYFSLVPPAYHSLSTDRAYQHVSHHSLGETAPGPSNSLPAYREVPCEVLSSMSSKSFHASSVRPQPNPVQNMLHVTGDSSSGSSSSSCSPYSSSPELARCSRCQRTPSFDLTSGKSNMVQYGLNLWYCNRCAALVGWSKG